MEAITPEAFWESFAKRLATEFMSNRRGMLKIYSSCKKWTKYLTEQLNQFGKTILPNGSIENEYWPRIDVAYFDHVATDWGKWALEVAIEIENDPDSWTDECRKLLLLNAGLKVLIGYRYMSIEHLENKLQELEEIYYSRKYNRKGDTWLLVFGPMNIEEDSIDYIAYKMVDGKISKLKNENVIYER